MALRSCGNCEREHHVNHRRLVSRSPQRGQHRVGVHERGSSRAQNDSDVDPTDDTKDAYVLEGASSVVVAEAPSLSTTWSS